MKNVRTRVVALIAVFALAALFTGCSNGPSDALSPEALSPLLSENDVPTLPKLDYVSMGDSEWELKRLRLSRDGFEVLDECGIVSRNEEGFSLSNTSDSYYRPSYLEENDDYLQAVLWTGLKDVFGIDDGRITRGFLEYYGGYYLIKGAGDNVVLYSLGNPPSLSGEMSLSIFCIKAWEFYCYVENAPETIYGGDGINTEALP